MLWTIHLWQIPLEKLYQNIDIWYRTCQAVNPPPQLGFRKTQSIRNLIIKVSTALVLLVKGYYKCRGCTVCSWTIGTKIFLLGKIRIELRSFTNFASKDICLFICLSVCLFIYFPCKLAHIGSTSRAQRTRISEHNSRIRNGCLEAPLTAHFLEFHQHPEDLRCLATDSTWTHL